MPSGRVRKNLGRSGIILVFAVTFLAAWRTGWPRPIQAPDVRQNRLDHAAPLPGQELMVEQSFTSRHDGLSSIELLLVVHSPEDEAVKPAVLTLRLFDETGREYAASSWDNRYLKHNDPLRFSFEPIEDSAGRQFRLRLDGSAGNRATAWAYSLDGYQQGDLSANGDPIGGDLRFKTTYRFLWAGALKLLGRMVGQNAGLILLLLGLLFLPGLALLTLTWHDFAVRLGVALAASLVFLPLVWLWLSVFGIRWTVFTIWLAFNGIVLLAFLRLRQKRPRIHVYKETWVLAGILGLALAVRLLAIRDQVLPAWVDSPQHWLISRMMAETGRVPDSYRPWMPVDVFWYHFGYHTLAASLQLLSGASLEKILLVGGQVMNALIPLSMYAGAVLLTGRRRVGLVAAFFTALLSIFPAYYVTWGRYTQLAGLLILPPLMGWIYRFFFYSDNYRRTRDALVIALLLGGLFLVHARVWVFAMAWLLVAAVGCWRPGRTGRAVKWCLALAAACFLAAAPWGLRVLQSVLLPMAEVAGVRGDPGDYNAIPWEYLKTGWERIWLAMAGVGLLWSAVVTVQRKLAHNRRRVCFLVSDPTPIGLLAAWILINLTLINANRIGVPTFGLVNNNTFIISLFVPVGVIIGWLVDEWYCLANGHPVTAWVAKAVLAAAGIWSGLWGIGQMVGIVNQDTVLATAGDLEMIGRMDDLLPADSLTAVNAWIWLKPANWAGSDAGYWLYLLSERQTTMPPIGYRQNREYGEMVNEFNQQMSQVTDWDSPETLEILHRRAVTHVFIGERGGFFKPEELVDSPNFTLLESNGGDWLFQVN